MTITLKFIQTHLHQDNCPRYYSNKLRRYSDTPTSWQLPSILFACTYLGTITLKFTQTHLHHDDCPRYYSHTHRRYSNTPNIMTFTLNITHIHIHIHNYPKGHSNTPTSHAPSLLNTPTSLQPVRLFKNTYITTISLSITQISLHDCVHLRVFKCTYIMTPS